LLDSGRRRDPEQSRENCDTDFAGRGWMQKKPSSSHVFMIDPVLQIVADYRRVVIALVRFDRALSRLCGIKGPMDGLLSLRSGLN
jgi:hypothetical protein